MNVRRASLLVIAKMALADGKVTKEEEEFLRPLLPEDENLDDLLAEAAEEMLTDLLLNVTSYPDRFFIALRVASMAHIDADFDVREDALYQRLVKLMQIEVTDQELIQRSVDALGSMEPHQPDPRIEKLYLQSSFR